jgi:hypothetical protein
MGFWERLRYGKAEDVTQPNIKFGRYTDSYKTTANYAAWDRALLTFENENYLESYRQFLTYLADEREENLRFWEENEGIRFELFQGSKKICGFANKEKIKVEAKVAVTQELNVGFMRRLIEKNFSLEYARFALDENDNIVILFDTYSIDGSPYKLYYAIKEVAINADKQDDLLLDEFRMLKAVDVSHLQDISLSEKEAKYDFLHRKIQETLDLIDKGNLSFDQYPGAYVYLLLDLVYKLDYLMRPEGYLMERLEFVHRQYFAKDDKKTLEKAQILARELQQLLDRPKEDLFKEMYRGRSTFGITMPVNHDRVVSSIDNELANMDWYIQNNHPAIALSIPGFIVGYCLFNYAIPKPARELFDLYYKITETGFFKAIGFKLDYYNPAEQKFNSRAIKRAIQRVVSQNKDYYPNLRPATAGLRFESMIEFTKSYLLMIRNMDMTKVQR